MNCKEAENFLDAYVDSELDLVRRLEIEQHLADCARCTSHFEKRRQLQGAVRSASLRFSPPAGLERRVHDRLVREVREAPQKTAPEFERRQWIWGWNTWLGGFGSAAALAAVLFIVGPYAGRSAQESRQVQELVDNHVRSLITTHLTDVQTSNQHVVKPWFNGRTDFSPTVKDFADHGFPLAGGRLDYLDHRPVAVLVYHRALHPINLYIWPASAREDLTERLFSRQGYHLVHWSGGGMAYWAVSDVNPAELQQFVQMVQSEELSPKTPDLK